MDTVKSWKCAVSAIKQIRDTVGPIAEVRFTSVFVYFFAELTLALQMLPHGSLAWSLLSKIPEVGHLALSEDIEHSAPSHVIARLCYISFSVMTMSGHYLRQYVMGLNLRRRRTF
jgi:hypothetical protein